MNRFAPRKLYRLDFSGQRQLAMVLAPRAAIDRPSYIGDTWVVTNEQDECLAIYVAGPRRTRATLGSPAPVPGPPPPAQ